MSWMSLARRVYPRACGGTCGLGLRRRAAGGLSPRVRGNRSRRACPRFPSGSIPARAGEPTTAAMSSDFPKVYPRACGGTARRPPPMKTTLGLSPRVRGNPGYGPEGPLHHGSIPARAGEPSPRLPRPSKRRVYPRACGGTPANQSEQKDYAGLSPRVRGNRMEWPPFRGGMGSIPARAGEPPRTGRLAGRARVYPRACGGTACLESAIKT